MSETERSAVQKPEIIAKKRHSALQKLRIWNTVRRAVSRPAFADEPREAFQRGVTGSLPTPAEGGIVLASCNDLYYWRFAITLVLSVESQRCAQRLHLHLCEPTDDTLRHIADMAARLEFVELTWTVDACELASGLRYRTVYLASVRFVIAATILSQCRSPILCIDVDAIAVKPVWRAYAPARVGKDIVLIQRREESSVSRRVRAGAVGFNPSPAGLRYADAVARSTAAIYAIRPIYHIDQIVLYFVMRAIMKRMPIDVGDMPAELSDFDFSDAGAIWMAKGWAMKNSDLYRRAKEAVDSAFPAITRHPTN